MKNFLPSLGRPSRLQLSQSTTTVSRARNPGQPPPVPSLDVQLVSTFEQIRAGGASRRAAPRGPDRGHRLRTCAGRPARPGRPGRPRPGGPAAGRRSPGARAARCPRTAAEPGRPADPGATAAVGRPSRSCSRYPQAVEKLLKQWRNPAEFRLALDAMLMDSRGGRQGFPFDVVSEFSTLREYYDQYVSPVRTSAWGSASVR